MSAEPPFIVVAVGLAFEARIARAAPGARICCGRGPVMEAALTRALGPSCAGILSFGIAGGLDPALRPGTTLIASTVIAEGGHHTTDTRWSRALLDSHPAAIHAPLLGVDEAIVDPAGKGHHFRRTGAAAVDMESHIAAKVARRHGLPFAVLRVIADPADRHVPPSAMRGVRADGRTDALAVLRALARRPREIAGVVGIARDAWTARTTLARCRWVAD
ncbi:MAG TPA: hypothetical protein VG986_07830 [Pseudolabrys sp.]|nr:hypothetical protein [Pseudolabrys sp.]